MKYDRAVGIQPNSEQSSHHLPPFLPQSGGMLGDGDSVVSDYRVDQPRAARLAILELLPVFERTQVVA